MVAKSKKCIFEKLNIYNLHIIKNKISEIKTYWTKLEIYDFYFKLGTIQFKMAVFNAHLEGHS